MPQTLPGSMGTAVQATVTDGQYLIKLGFPSEIRRATKTQLTYSSQVYTVEGARVHSVSPTDAMLSLPNHDASNSSLVLDNHLPDIDCDIYIAYGSDVLLHFSGVLDEGEIGSRVVFTARRGSRAKVAPNAYITPPTFNHIAPRGLELRWGSDTLVLT